MQPTPREENEGRVPEIPPLVTGVDDRAKVASFNTHVAGSKEFRQALEAAAMVPGLLNNGNPNAVIAKETPRARAMCYAAMEGHTNKAIAEQFDCSPAYVSQVLRQPWAKKFMTEEFRRIAADEGGVLKFLASEALNCARDLIEIRDNPSTPAKTKADIDNSVLDRVFGKATVFVKSEATVSHEQASEEAEQIEKQINDLRKQLGEAVTQATSPLQTPRT